jgi:2',3'-cyclic-nucleotide 2'-phosphodiesterase (5'-nucleotidase family)
LGKMKRKTLSLLTAFVFLLSYVFPFLGQALAEDLITVQQAIENNSGSGTVEGYIVGHAKGTNSYNFQAPFTDGSNFQLAYDPNERDNSKLTVQVSSSFRGEFGLKMNSNILGQKFRVTGSLTALYMEEHGRASDHDPVLVQLDLKSGPFKLSLMHTNDTHAHLDNIPRLFTAVEQIRSESKNHLLLNAGDVFSGTLFFNKYLGQADLEFMNQLQYDAMTFGNHEFDKDSSVLADFIKNAEFPFVSSNIQFENDADLGPLFNNQIGNPAEPATIYPAIVKTISGEQVGIFGLTTEDTAFLANPGENIVFEDVAQKSAQTVKMLQDEGVNKIIAITHLGYNHDQKLAEEVAGIDVIIGGHTHTKLASPVVKNETAEPTVIVQASEYGRYLGHLNVAFDENGIVTEWNGNLLDLLQKDEAGRFVYSENEWAKQRLAELSAPIEELKNQIVGYTNVALDGERSNVRTKETNLGNLIADSMLAKARESVNAQIAVHPWKQVKFLLEKF